MSTYLVTITRKIKCPTAKLAKAYAKEAAALLNVGGEEDHEFDAATRVCKFVTKAKGAVEDLCQPNNLTD